MRSTMASKSSSIPTPHLGRNRKRGIPVETQILVYLPPDVVHIGSRHVNFVDDGKNFKVVLKRHIHV